MIHNRSLLVNLSDSNMSVRQHLATIAKVIVSSLLLVLGARVAFILPFSPVPFTWQTEALIILSLIWGRKIAVGAVLAYFLEGLSGLPVFAEGSFGIWPFFSASGGYLIGFLPAAYIMGTCADRGWTKSILLTALAVFLGKFMVYSCGLLWLSLILPVQQVLRLGLLPYLPETGLQIILAALIAPGLHMLNHKISNKK